MKCRTLLRAYCRYRLFEREIICKRDEPLKAFSRGQKYMAILFMNIII